MRTLLHAFSTFDLGGSQARFVSLANAYGPAYRHLIVAMDGHMQAAERLAANVNWQAMPIANRRGGALANRAAFRQALHDWQPDLVFSYNWGAIEWAVGNRPRRVPHVHVEDGFGPAEAQGQLPRRVWGRRAILGLGHAHVVVPSRRLALCAQAWWMPPRRLRYIPNGVPVLAAAGARPVVPPGRPLVIGTVTGLRPEKNLARLLRAFAVARREHDLRLLIVGDGAERGALEALAQTLGVAADITFTGYLRAPQERLREMDLFALSSDTEQQPISMLEAMALGIPVIATRVGDVPFIVPAAVGEQVLCEPADAAFSATLQSVLNQRDAWPQWAAANLARARSHFAFDDMVERWRLVFDGHADAVPDLLAQGRN
jgi:glycosyltransferase involved in cell wall biosynthesis